MGNCNFCGLFANINWLSYAISVAIVFLIGAFWYSKLFAKTWMEVNNIEKTTKPSRVNIISTMFMQLLVTALLGLVFFVLNDISTALAVLVAVAFAGWIKATLKFKISNWKSYFKAALIDAGYFSIAVIVFILFAFI